jgi:hypothetical protein
MAGQRNKKQQRYLANPEKVMKSLIAKDPAQIAT